MFRGIARSFRVTNFLTSLFFRILSQELRKSSEGQIAAFIPESLINRIIGSLKSLNGFEEIQATNEYEAIRGKIRDRILIIYRSGSIVYDGSLNEVRRILEENFYEYYSEEGLVVGSDEVGKGEALGPLVVAATALNPKQAAYLQSIGVTDSKRIPDRRIPKLAREIRRGSLGYGISRIDPLKLNEILEAREKYGNLNDVLTIMHSKVLTKVVSRLPERRLRVVVDKFDSSKSGRRMKTIEKALGGLKVEDIIWGERVPAVAAASILARASYLVWIRRNLSEGILKRIREGDYSILPKEKLPIYFKMLYLGLSQQR